VLLQITEVKRTVTMDPGPPSSSPSTSAQTQQTKALSAGKSFRGLFRFRGLERHFL